MRPCLRCQSPAIRGLLCTGCAELLPTVSGLLPAHIASPAGPPTGAWLIDGFGVAHRVATPRAVVGRRPGADLTIHNTSISRDHAELRRAGDAWELRDLGSRNGSFVDGVRVAGRSALADGATVRFGDVALWLCHRTDDLTLDDPASIETSHAGAAAMRHIMSDGVRELCHLGSHGDDGDGAGVLLHRRRGAAAWNELALPRLEHRLLQLLCEAAVEAGDAAGVRATVATKVLVRRLPFQSRYANEENVRQVVRRLRDTLAELGAEGLVATVPGRGYYLSWPVSVA
ncbi:MAG: FHA domain-containing protein [Myxococcales bacterium]|nr:FHA domain-containing protein [Myxococcales bacterium]